MFHPELGIVLKGQQGGLQNFIQFILSVPTKLSYSSQVMNESFLIMLKPPNFGLPMNFMRAHLVLALLTLINILTAPKTNPWETQPATFLLSSNTTCNIPYYCLCFSSFLSNWRILTLVCVISTQSVSFLWGPIISILYVTQIY